MPENSEKKEPILGVEVWKKKTNFQFLEQCSADRNLITKCIYNLSNCANGNLATLSLRRKMFWDLKFSEIGIFDAEKIHTKKWNQSEPWGVWYFLHKFFYIRNSTKIENAWHMQKLHFALSDIERNKSTSVQEDTFFVPKCLTVTYGFDRFEKCSRSTCRFGSSDQKLNQSNPK